MSPLLDPEAKLIGQAMGILRAQLLVDGKRAAESVANLLEQAGVLVFPALRNWAEDPDPRVRKGLVKAVAHAADPYDPFRAAFLFDLLEPLLWDSDAGVRAAARRVLRKKLIPACPEEALHALARWAAEPNPQKQVLAARCLGHLPPALARRALIPLRHLVRTQEEKVRRAALLVLKIWYSRDPRVVETELKRWENDAELAQLIRHVTT